MLISDWYTWSPVSAIPPILGTIIAFTYALYILAYPPVYKKLSIAILAIPTTYAFIHHQKAVPDYMLADTFGRFLYIWYAHMSYEVVILEFAPTIEKENTGWKNKVYQAYSVLFDRNHTQVVQARVMIHDQRQGDALQGKPATTAVTTKSKGKESHGYGYVRFTCHHILQIVIIFCLLSLNDQFRSSSYTSTVFYELDVDPGSFFRRLPASLNPDELYYRVHCSFDWVLVSLLEYEFYYSVFAFLFVSVLQFDPPSQWHLSLCGHLSEAWSVRRYWGKHWHNYIYHSFNAHTQIVTRKWLGLKRGHIATRLLENTIVFAASGLMHTVVRKQQAPKGELWAITYWYIAQMLPIALEGVVQHYWHCLRKHLNIQEYNRWINGLELAVGYAWVMAWFMWSIPKYNAMEASWGIKHMEAMYGKDYIAEVERAMSGNNTN